MPWPLTAAATAEAVAGIEVLPDSRAAAFFDLDNTVLRGASLFYLARGMHQRKLLRTGDIVRFAYQQTRFAIGAEDPAQMNQARAAALSFIATRLGLTGALGTVAEHAEGYCTGRLVGDLLHGPAKADAVRALADREGLELERCSAYSDSANDIPMLSLVGNPCAVNPDARLRAHARTHGWRIRDYRARRRNTRLGVAAGTGAVAGAVVGVAAARRRSR